MAINQTTTTSFRVQLLQGVHNFDSDVFYIALYTGAASLGADTTVYTSTGEISGTGYTAGGQALTVSVPPTSANNAYDIPTAYISFQNSVWSNASFTTRGALIYNQSKGNKSVAVLDFGNDKTVVGSTFTVQFPTADANSAIVRIS
jgi:hypothetical protein